MVLWNETSEETEFSLCFCTIFSEALSRAATASKPGIGIAIVFKSFKVTKNGHRYLDMYNRAIIRIMRVYYVGHDGNGETA